jgi:hypothetical protein
MAHVRASRSTVIGATVWLAVVLVCSTLVWAVISRAGEGVTADQTPTRGQTTSTPRDASTPTKPPPTSPKGTPSSPDAAVERTWSGTGGVVVVVCRGAAAELGPASPDTGFAIEVDETGPRRVQVEFEGQGDNDAKTRVRAWCVDGESTFEVDSD